jgi:hypothetical protein
MEKIAVTGNRLPPQNGKYSLQTVACHCFQIAARQFLPLGADGSRRMREDPGQAGRRLPLAIMRG